MMVDFMFIEGAKIYQLNVVKYPFLLLFNKVILFFSLVQFHSFFIHFFFYVSSTFESNFKPYTFILKKTQVILGSVSFYENALGQVADEQGNKAID